MDTEFFANRLTQLRTAKNVSAREMSLALGQNPGYINSIETGKSMPSMLNFLYICEYFQLEPKDFFDIRSDDPLQFQQLVEKLRRLNTAQLDAISSLVDTYWV